jgi:hypothetical protein
LLREVVFGDAALDQAIDQPPRPRQKRRIERGLAEQGFEVAEPGRVAIDAGLVEHQRCRRQEIRAEPDRADEPVFDANELDAARRGSRRKTGRLAGCPHPDRAAARDRCPERALYGAAEHRRATLPCEEIAEAPALPPRDADADRNRIGAALKSCRHAHRQRPTPTIFLLYPSNFVSVACDCPTKSRGSCVASCALRRPLELRRADGPGRSAD